MNTFIEQFRKELIEIALYADDTVANYISCIYKYVEFVQAKFKLDPIKSTPDHIKQWMIYLKKTAISNGRLNHHRSALKSFFSFISNIHME